METYSEEGKVHKLRNTPLSETFGRVIIVQLLYLEIHFYAYFSVTGSVFAKLGI